MIVRRPRAGTGERGVSVIIFALMLTVLLTASAFAIDIGAAYNERRHDQNTVDAAVMSGAVTAAVEGGVIDDVVAEVRDKVDTTLARSVPPEAWEACEDPGHLLYTTRDLQAGNPTIDPVTDCISFDASFNEIRVRLPDQEAMSFFGPALGFGRINTSASAKARIQSPGGLGAPPFVALSTATTGDFVCLRTSSSGEPIALMDGMGPTVAPAAGSRPDPCDSTVYNPDSQSFGTLSPYRYLEGCTRQKADTEVAISIGIDHAMGHYPVDPATGVGYTPGDEERIDGDVGCTTAYPNTFKVETGFNAQGLRCALISLRNGPNSSSCNNVKARLQSGESQDTTNTFAGEPLDNSAPWDFLRPADQLWLGTVDGNNNQVIPPFPASSPARPYCAAAATFREDDDTFDPGYSPGVPDIDDYLDEYIDPVHGTHFTMKDLRDGDWDIYDRYDAFVACLELWDPSTDPQLFTEDIASSPRFAFIPQVYEDNLDVSYVHIEGFLPSYIYRLYQSVNNGTPCNPLDTRTNVPFYLHDAGQQTGACGVANQNVDRMASLIFACGMVPDTLCNRDTGEPDFAGGDIYDFRLVE